MSKAISRNVLVSLIMLFIVLLAANSAMSLMLFSTGDLGYSTGFQGPKARFIGAEFEGKRFTSSGATGIIGGDDPTGTNIFSITSFDTTLRFDPDGYDSGKPNLIGEMTSVFVPEESLRYSGWQQFPDWGSWISRLRYIQNPQQNYSWTISDKVYVMEEWVMKWYVSFTTEWDGEEAPPTIGPAFRNYFSDLEVWLEFDISPTWYIEGGGTAYFALGSLRVSEVNKRGVDANGDIVTYEGVMSVTPESVGAGLFIYTGLWGGASAESQAKTYQGKALNPDLFRDKVYAHIDFNNFGVSAWSEMLTWKAKGDVITMGFDVTVFVIGEWQVKDIQSLQEIQDDFGRSVKTYMPPSLIDYLGDPRIQGLLALLATVGVLIILMIFAPGFIFMLISLLTNLGRGRRR